METVDLTWCDEHTAYLKEQGVSTETLIDTLLTLIAREGVLARGHSTPEDKMLAAKALKTASQGKPYCCHLGDEKLKKIVQRVHESLE